MTVQAQPVPQWALDYELIDKAISGLGKTIGAGLIQNAKAMGVTNLPPQLDDLHAQLTAEVIIEVLRDVAWHLFPKTGPRRRSPLAVSAFACAQPSRLMGCRN